MILICSWFRRCFPCCIFSGRFSCDFIRSLFIVIVIYALSLMDHPVNHVRFLSSDEDQVPEMRIWFSSPWGVRLKCYYAFFLVCCGCDTSYIVSVHIHCQASIYTLSLCRGYSLRVRLAKQETLTPPGHLVSPLVCRGPWMSTMVLYCWCNSDSASVILYLTYC